MTSILCGARRCGGHPCGGHLVERVNRIIGTIAFVCPRCERRKAGICAECDRPVEGTRGKAERCAVHKRRRIAAVGDRSRARNADAIRVRALVYYRKRVAVKRNGRPPMTRQQSGQLGSAARAAALSPERRAEIARLAGLASGIARRERRAA